MYSSIEDRSNSKSSPLKKNTNNHKSSMGLRTVETSNDQFLSRDKKSLSPSKHTMSSRIKTQINFNPSSKHNLNLTEKRNSRQQFVTNQGFFVNRINTRDINNQKENKLVKLNLKDHIKSLVSKNKYNS